MDLGSKGLRNIRNIPEISGISEKKLTMDRIGDVKNFVHWKEVRSQSILQYRRMKIIQEIRRKEKEVKRIQERRRRTEMMKEIGNMDLNYNGWKFQLDENCTEIDLNESFK